MQGLRGGIRGDARWDTWGCAVGSVEMVIGMHLPLL